MFGLLLGQRRTEIVERLDRNVLNVGVRSAIAGSHEAQALRSLLGAVQAYFGHDENHGRLFAGGRVDTDGAFAARAQPAEGGFRVSEGEYGILHDAWQPFSVER